MLKVIFLGTPKFAVPVLDRIAKEHNVVAVVTQPDKPRGRNMRPTFSPVKELALKLNIPVFQYKSISKEGYDELKSLNADIIVTCAFGQILRQNILEMTPYGVYNVHGSILPKYRGAAPIQRAIMEGETKTGITILKSEIGIDDGDILLTKECDILPNDTAGTLFDKLSVLGADCISEALKILESGKYTLIKQNHELSTYAKMIKADDEYIDFCLDANQIRNIVRGLNPSPLAKFIYNGNVFKVFETKAWSLEEFAKYPVSIENFECGQVVLATPKAGLFVKSNNSICEIVVMQPANSKPMTAKAYLNGRKINVGDTLQREDTHE